MPRRPALSRTRLLPLGLAGALLLPCAARADDAAQDSLWSRPNLLGPLGGARDRLADHGISLTVQETDEVLGNVGGGSRRAAEYDGLTQATLQVDTGKAFGLDGGLFNASILDIHGRNLGAETLQGLQSASGISGNDALRLWELWYQQNLTKDGTINLRIGQQSLDQEFMVSPSANTFFNATFGWPALPSNDLPGGGPAYPLSALGGRLHAQISPSVTVLAGVFSGTPLPPGNGDAQGLNHNGLAFPWNGALMIAELQVTTPLTGAMQRPDEKAALPGIYKLGFWYNTLRFADLAIDNTGLSLADPASTGIARSYPGDLAFYGVADQAIWQDGTVKARTLNLFLRAQVAPQSDRNLVDATMNAGLVLHAPFAGRENDSAGIALGYAHVSGRAAALDAAMTGFGTPTPVRGGEIVAEATYQFQAAPWWLIQPDLQYVYNPGGGIENPLQPGRRIGNETILGLRSTITF
ncbi:MAG: carbohydrate porin [Rhodospirillales bacterium]|nr:carbohydrate porin [Rhodospirillales bacterium]